MDRDVRWLTWSLRAGSLYFLLVAVAHALGFKVPGLFIYFDVPSYAYQDHIISFLSLGWSILFWVVALEPGRDTRLLNVVLIMGAAGLAGLGLINLTTDFGALKDGLQPGVYWIETAVLAGYLLLLIILTLRLRRGE
jgi:hypothetical protein